MLSLALNMIWINLFTTLQISSEVGQRINLNFSSIDKLRKYGEIEEILPKKHLLFVSNRGQNSKKWRSSSISPVEQYSHDLDANGVFVYLPTSILSLLEEDRMRDIQHL